jgi:cytoskeletal protein RodZ
VSHTFTPPLVADRPPISPEEHPGNSLWRHFQNRNRGVNVWILSDGTVVQDTATAENANTNMTPVYPWDVNNAAAPYVTTHYVPALPAAQVGITTTVSHNPYPVANFYGGSTYSITDAQYTTLSAAGYTTSLT